MNQNQILIDVFLFAIVLNIVKFLFKIRTVRKEEFRNKVDDIFLVFFPVMFFIFNFVSEPKLRWGI